MFKYVTVDVYSEAMQIECLDNTTDWNNAILTQFTNYIFLGNSNIIYNSYFNCVRFEPMNIV